MDSNNYSASAFGEPVCLAQKINKQLSTTLNRWRCHRSIVSDLEIRSFLTPFNILSGFSGRYCFKKVEHTFSILNLLENCKVMCKIMT